MTRQEEIEKAFDETNKDIDKYTWIKACEWADKNPILKGDELVEGAVWAHQKYMPLIETWCNKAEQLEHRCQDLIKKLEIAVEAIKKFIVIDDSKVQFVSNNLLILKEALEEINKLSKGE